MKVIEFDSCGGCPYFRLKETGIKIEREPFQRRDVYCSHLNKLIQSNVKFELALRLMKVIPDWCILPDKQINGIPQT